MKGFIILVIVLIIGFIIYAAGRKQEVEKQNDAKKPPVVQNEQKPSKPSKAEQVVQEVQDTASYATGYTQVKAGNNAKDKIKNIQQQQNQRQQEALAE